MTETIEHDVTIGCTPVQIGPRGPAAVLTRDAYRTVLCLRGEHDISTVTEVCESLSRAIAFDESDVVVDLSEVRFLDAATVGVLVRARLFLRQRSRSLALRAVSSRVQRILDICDVCDLMEPEAFGATAPRSARQRSVPSAGWAR